MIFILCFLILILERPHWSSFLAINSFFVVSDDLKWLGSCYFQRVPLLLLFSHFIPQLCKVDMWLLCGFNVSCPLQVTLPKGHIWNVILLLVQDEVHVIEGNSKRCFFKKNPTTFWGLFPSSLTLVRLGELEYHFSPAISWNLQTPRIFWLLDQTLLPYSCKFPRPYQCQS